MQWMQNNLKTSVCLLLMNRRSYNTKIRCYDCGDMVYDLKSHRRHCNDTKIRNWSKKIRCYACNKEVYDLKRHKADECGKSTIRTITHFANTSDFYMLLDVSSSMSGRRLDDAKTTFCEIEELMNSDDRIAVVTFDTNAYFKLKPRPVGQIRRQKELPDLLARIYAKGMTAIWDAIWLSVEQLADKNRETLMIALTDGEDNSSKHTYQQVQDLIDEYSNVRLSIIHIDGSGRHCAEYQQLCQGRGEYKVIAEAEITVSIKTVFHKYYIKTDEK